LETAIRRGAKKDAKQTPAALTETLAKLKANETKGKQ